MNGTILPGTSIAVDYWQAQRSSRFRLFFLTHLHGDHIVGLTSTWRQPVYCSPLTGRLLVDHYGVRSCLVHTLQEGQSHLIGYCPNSCIQNHTLVLTEASTNGQNMRKRAFCSSISVTVINANHCPGAVMFLFEGPFGKILHTGDFRYSPDMLQEGSVLSRHIGSIDRLYLDNTYCSTECCFPSREDVLKEIIRIVKRHPDHDIVFGLRSLGKEELLANVAVALKEWINVPPKMFSVMVALDFPNFFKTDSPNQRIRVERFEKISSNFVRDLNSRKPTIVILPTALYTGIGGRPYSNLPEVFVVPYSDHSSFPELILFVAGLRPSCVVPVVNGKSRGPFGIDISNRARMDLFQPYLSTDKTLKNSSVKEISSHDDGTAQSMGGGFDHLFPDLCTDQMLRFKRKKSLTKKGQAQRHKKLLTTGVSYLSEEDDTKSGCSSAVQNLTTRTVVEKVDGEKCIMINQTLSGELLTRKECPQQVQKLNGDGSFEELSTMREAEEISTMREDKELSAMRDDKELSTMREDKELSAMREDEELSTMREDEELSTMREPEELSTMRENEELSTMGEDEELSTMREDEELSTTRDAVELSTMREASKLNFYKKTPVVQSQLSKSDIRNEKKCCGLNCPCITWCNDVKSCSEKQTDEQTSDPRSSLVALMSMIRPCFDPGKSIGRILQTYNKIKARMRQSSFKMDKFE